MKWIGQHIVDFIARFRSDVYLESLTTTSETNVLVVDSDGKVSKSTSVAGDLTSIVAGTGLSGTDLAGPIPTINVDAAQPGITSLGTLTALDVDDINLNGKVITITGDTDDTFSITAGAAGLTTLATTDNTAAGGHLKLQADGTIYLESKIGKTIFRDIDNAVDYMQAEIGTHGGATLTTIDSAAGNAHFEIAADGNITLDAAGDIALEAGGNDVTIEAASVEISNDGGGQAPYLKLLNANADADGPFIQFFKSADGADGDSLGKIVFKGDGEDGADAAYGQITCLIADATPGEEAGKLQLKAAQFNHTLAVGLELDGDTNVSGEVDVNIAAGAASLTTIAGTLTMGSTAAMTNAGLLSVAAQTNITSLGTLTALDVDNININGDTITASGDMALVATGNDITVDTDNLVIESATNLKPLLTLKATNTLGGSSGELRFLKDADDVGDGEYLGQISWYGDNDAGTPETIRYASIYTRIGDVTDGEESANMYLSVASYDGASTIGLQLIGDTNADGEVDVTIAAGAASTTTVAGELAVVGDLLTVGGGVHIVAVSGGAITIGQANRPLTVSATSIDLSSTPGCTVDIDRRRFAVTSSTDGNHEGDVVYFGGTTSMTVGTIYNYKSDGTWEPADADDVATCDGLLAVALGAASDTNGMLLRGMVTLDHDPGAVGDVLFVSTTAGDATATAPSGNNDIVRIIGYCLNAAAGQIWFNPDNTFVKITA